MSYNNLSFGILYNKFVDTTGNLTTTVLQWMSTGLIPAVNNTTPKQIPGPFANDSEAQAGGVPVGALYYVSGSRVNVRLI